MASLIIVITDEQHRTLAIGPFLTTEGAEQFANEVVPGIPGGVWRHDVLVTPDEYIEHDE